MKTIRTNYSDWDEINGKWRSEKFEEFMNLLFQIKSKANRAVEEVEDVGDVGTLSNPLTNDILWEFDEKHRDLKLFSDKIHFALKDEIDDFFYNQILGFATNVFQLNPNSLCLTESGTVFNRTNTTAFDGLVDSALLQDFAEKRDELSIDEPTEDLLEEIDEAGWQWKQVISYEDVKEIERIIFASKEGADDWNAKYEAGDPNCPFPLADVQDLYYDMSMYWVIKDASSEDAFYRSSESGIYINMSKESNNPRNPYTMYFHEMSHMLDNSVVELVNGDGIECSTNVYLSTAYSEHAEDFYEALISDVNTYRDNFDLAAYNLANGTGHAKVEEAIKEELEGADIGEFSDIIGGVTDNEYVTEYSYAHSDKKKFLINIGTLQLFEYFDSYWNYNDFTNLPDIEPLNKEAFAHFTEISIMQDPDDLANLAKYFPTAYEEYCEMIEDINEEVYE